MPRNPIDNTQIKRILNLYHHKKRENLIMLICALKSFENHDKKNTFKSVNRNMAILLYKTNNGKEDKQIKKNKKLKNGRTM